MEGMEIVDTNVDNILEYGVCGYKNIKRAGYPEKIEWLTDRFSEGLKLKSLYSDGDGAQGMIVYIPGEYCWRPVEASGYIFIHCIFVGLKRAYKWKGYGSLLLDECLKDAKVGNKHGVAVVTRKGAFIAGIDLSVMWRSRGVGDHRWENIEEMAGSSGRMYIQSLLLIYRQIEKDMRTRVRICLRYLPCLGGEQHAK